MESTGAKWGDETTVGAGLVVGLTWRPNPNPSPNHGGGQA